MHIGKLSRAPRKTSLLVLGATVLLATGCAAAPQDSAPKTVAKPEASSTESVSPASGTAEVTTTAPDVSGSTTVFVRVADRTGSARLAVVRTIPPGTVAVATECSGKGKLVVRIGGLTTYTTPCTGTSAMSYNEIGLVGAKANVAITTTAAPGTHWGLSVGWHAGMRREP